MTIQKGKMKNLGIPDVQSANPGAQKAYVPTPWPDGQHPCTKEPAKTSGTWGAHGCPCSSVVPPGNSLWVSRSIAFDHSSLRKSLKTPIFCCLKTCDSLIFWAVSPIFIPQLQHSALASLIDWPGDKNAELVQHTTRTWLVTGIPWGNGTGTRKITSHEIWKDDSMTMAWFVIITSLLKWVSLQGSGPVGYQLPKNWVNQVLFGAPPEDFLGGTPGFHPSALVLGISMVAHLSSILKLSRNWLKFPNFGLSIFKQTQDPVESSGNHKTPSLPRPWLQDLPDFCLSGWWPLYFVAQKNRIAASEVGILW